MFVWETPEDVKECLPSLGDTKIEHKFIWWPKSLPIKDNRKKRQTRWLGVHSIEYKYGEYIFFLDGCEGVSNDWLPQYWTEEKKKSTFRSFLRLILFYPLLLLLYTIVIVLYLPFLFFNWLWEVPYGQKHEAGRTEWREIDYACLCTTIFWFILLVGIILIMMERCKQ